MELKSISKKVGKTVRRVLHVMNILSIKIILFFCKLPAFTEIPQELSSRLFACFFSILYLSLMLFASFFV